MHVALKRFWVRLTADRRRFGVLCCTASLGLLLWARLLVISNMPRTAIADPDDPNSAVVAHTQDDSILNPENVEISIALDRDPTRDPFSISSVHFPRPNPVGDLIAEAGKSDAQQSEDPEQAAERLQSLAGRITLDAAMSSSHLAVIDGRTFRIGDLVPVKGSERIRFRLAEVRQRSVILEIEGHRFELNMEGPGG